jgi:hypothetical protein
VCAYGAALWLADGAVRDGFLKADLRLLVLGAGMFALAATCRREGTRVLLMSLLAVAILTAAKSIAIMLSDLWVIGENDRLQASMVLASPVRVILMGGDTLLALTPALVVLAAAIGVSRALCGVAAVAALTGLLIGGTRTSLLVAVGLAFATAAAILLFRGRRPSRRQLMVAAGALALLIGAALAFGILQRFLQPDKPHVGLNFRRDEISLFLGQSARDLLLGHGWGGSYLGKGADGRIAPTGWSHALPVWLDLKLGLAGLLAALAGLVLVARTAWRAPRTPLLACGAVILAGLLGLSATLDRLALPEGAVLVGFALACLCIREAER